jgi:hypothetical protein
MVWVRIDDQFAEDPKVVEVGPLGMALQVAALCYANRKLTDGHIPRSVARTLLDFEVVTDDGKVHTIARTCGMTGDDVTADWVIDLLVEAGLWHLPWHDCSDCPQIEKGYYIHDYLEYQPSRDEVEEKHRQKVEAGKKGAEARWGSNRHSSSHSNRHSSSDGTTNGKTMPPNPNPNPKEKERSDSDESDDFPEEVIEVTRHLAKRVQANGFTVPSKGQKRLTTWLTEMDRLLRKGPPGGDEQQDPDEIRKLIDWATEHKFWRSNIQSPSSLREQLPRLKLQMADDEPEELVDAPGRMHA